MGDGNGQSTNVTLQQICNDLSLMKQKVDTLETNFDKMEKKLDSMSDKMDTGFKVLNEEKVPSIKEDLVMLKTKGAIYSGMLGSIAGTVFGTLVALIVSWLTN